MAKTWLFKTEPSAYSYADLERDGRTTWDGIKNPAALKHLAAIEPGDEIFVYHTGEEKAVVGLARATSRAYPDPKTDDSKRLVIDVENLRPLPASVRLASLKADPRLGSFELVRLPRLSVMPVSSEARRIIETLAGRP